MFIHDPASRWDEFWELATITTEFLVEDGARIAALPFEAGAYGDQTRPLMREIAEDGRLL